MSDELPEGWAQASVGDAGIWRSGGTPSRKMASYFGGSIPWVKSGDLTDGIVTGTEENLSEHGVANSSAKLLPVGTVSVALYGATIGKLGVLGIAAATNQACANCQVDGRLVDRWFLFYYLLGQRSELIAAGQGGAQPNISGEILKAWPLPLPPLAEQRRIVAKVEVLLAEVNAARERLAKVPAILKRFRQSVLAAACSGRLTEEWRERNEGAQPIEEVLRRSAVERIRKKGACESGRPQPPSTVVECKAPEGWALVSMDALTTRITSGSRDWRRYYREDGTSTFVMAQNVRPMFFDRSYRLRIEPPLGDRDRDRSEVRKEDLLITIVGANTGDACRVSTEVRDHFVCQSVALLRPALPDIAPFLELVLNSPAHGRAQFEALTYGEGRPHLSFDHLRSLAIHLPSLDEQREIVRRVESLFKAAETVEKHIAAATARADKITQAVLAKAFRGELVPTEAELAREEGREYEPASVLLERSAKERATSGTGGTKKRPKRDAA